MINDAIALSVQFFEQIKGMGKDEKGRIKAPDKYKGVVMKDIEQVLAGGMPPHELSSLFTQYKKQHPTPHEAYSIDDVLSYLKVNAKKKEVKHDPNNLLEPGRFYYHPELQVVPPPPKVVQLPDGTFESSYEHEEFFLEIREKFTLEDLVNYFYRRMEIEERSFVERDMGAFRHMLKSIDLDTLLYTIDAARFMSEDLDKPRPKNPFDIRDYLEEGVAILEERQNTCYMEGLNHVIPRTK